MLKEIPYDRERAVAYARHWAHGRNPLFYNFTGIGGDCTNFVSQCIYAGCCAMNFTKDTGWYYASLQDRAAAWSGVRFFYQFVTQNQDAGPYGIPVDETGVFPGDIVQLGHADGTFYHTLFISGADRRSLLVCAHSDNARDRRLSSYSYDTLRFIHIKGARTRSSEPCRCFTPLFTGEDLLLCP